MCPNERVVTIRDEQLVRIILDDNYELYRMHYPDDAIEVNISPDLIMYAAEGDPEWNESFHKSLHPHEFEDVKVMIEAHDTVQMVKEEREKNERSV
jgi:hypothetical protein